MDEKENVSSEISADDTKGGNEEVSSHTPSVNETNDKPNISEVKDTKTVENTFTQSQVNDMVRERLERERLSTFNRYGVKDRNGLDELVAKAQSYEEMASKYDEMIDTNSQLIEKLAFIENDIDPSRYDDIRAQFKGKDIAFSAEALKSELEKHPEWRKQSESKAPITTISNISPQRGGVDEEVNEADEMAKLFGLKKIIK